MTEKGVAWVKLEDGRVVCLTKYNYMKMRDAGRKVELIKEAEHYTEL
jgi:hypothetical protein